MPKNLNTRAVAARLSWQIIDKGNSLDAAISDYFETHSLSPQDRGLVQEMVYGVCRWYGALDHLSKGLLKKPIRNKDRAVHFLLLVGLYQLRHMNTAEHAAVAETVEACAQLQKVWAKNLINGCLRSHLRDRDSTSRPDSQRNSENDALFQLSHPQWMASAIQEAWPNEVDKILRANNNRPPMCLRVNSREIERDLYLQELKSVNISSTADPYSRDGIILEKAVAVNILPHFEDGMASVQDTAAQLACQILSAEQGMSVLDACAAPGGKAAHILENADDDLELHALDISERRCEQLSDTLRRLNLNANIYVADASKTPSWPTPKNGYDRILLDAPCSGLGVVRRHPDIKHHRQPEDVIKLNGIQESLLDQLWLLLKPHGKLLYMTCSIIPSENELQIARFLSKHSDAKLDQFNHPNAIDLDLGKQTLPGVHQMDGFYYCLLEKLL